MTAIQDSKTTEKELRARIVTMVEEGCAKRRISIEAGISGPKLQQWLDGVSFIDVLEALATWLVEIDQQNDSKEPALVDTETSGRIVYGLEVAQKEPTIALIHGGAGVGKTTTARGFAGQQQGCYYACASPAIRTPGQILDAIAKAMWGRYDSAYRIDTLLNHIMDDFLKRYSRDGGLLIIDEAQWLEADALDMVRVFLDQAQIGIAYLGNDEVFTKISGKGRRAAFAQLSSRVGVRVHVPAPQPSDIDAVLEAWAVKGVKERDYAHQIAGASGGLRQLSQVLRRARERARELRIPVDLRLMRSAVHRIALVV